MLTIPKLPEPAPAPGVFALHRPRPRSRKVHAMNVWKPRVLAMSLSLLLFPAGCSTKAGPEFVPVSGRVMMDKRPLAKAIVHFHPADRQGGAGLPDSYGETDEQGYFVLKPAVP